MPRKFPLKSKENILKADVPDQPREKTRTREALQNIDNIGSVATVFPPEKVEEPVILEPEYDNIIVRVHENSSFERFMGTETTFMEFGDPSVRTVEYMGYLENFATVPSDFMEAQIEIDLKTRSRMIDRLVEAHRCFNLVQETLFITVQLLDRYTNKKQIPSSDYILIAITCFLVASKYEERQYPPIESFAEIANDRFTPNEILTMESTVLKTIHFDFSPTLPIYFLVRIKTLCGIGQTHFHLANYFLEVCLTDGLMSCHLPSILAAASMYLAITVTNSSQHESSIEIVTGYNKDQIMPIMKRIPTIIDYNESEKLQAVYKKYSMHERSCVSTMPQLRLNHFRNLTYFSR
ncbi:G2/mitotic-specific cyclin-B [Thelohanellus kitauei]|uniref:G2/mitotic-specific cyclin-B n=1 Tax=Thelohanellus kitauei TaxID=669202 RepID=A0A0C2JZ36_THEKT|nr:G2/mitotic-specific cyclin-B [Thelohanellus kitauei]